MSFQVIDRQLDTSCFNSFTFQGAENLGIAFRLFPCFVGKISNPPHLLRQLMGLVS